MTRDDILSSTKLKEQFVRDNDLPITVFRKNLFLQRLNLLDPIFGCRKAFDLFCQELSKYRDEDQYFRKRNYSLDAVLANLFYTPEAALALIRFRDADLSERFGVAPYLPSAERESFYCPDNAGRTFVRIRFRHGIFSAIHHYDSSLLPSDDPESFIACSDRHLSDSTEFRQSILRSFGLRRVSQLEVVYLSSAAFYLHSFFLSHPSPYINSGLLYEVPPDALLTDEALDEYSKQVERALLSLPDGLCSCFELEIFRLENLKSLGFMEEYHRKRPISVRFIDADPNLYHLLATYYFRQPILNDYLVINYHGCLAKLEEPIPNPFRR